MFSSARYFATVRRAMTMPFSLSILTISWSDKRLARVLAREHLRHHVFDAGVGDAVAAVGLNARR